MDYSKFKSDIATADPPSFNTWKPVAGDSIVGEFLSISVVGTEYGQGKRADIRKSDGNIVSLWLNIVLERQFENQIVKAGDVIGIRFFGKQVNEKTGRSYKSYALKVYQRSEHEAGPAKKDDDFEDDIPF